MKHSDVFNAFSLPPLKYRLYSCLVRTSSLVPVEELKTKIQSMVNTYGLDPSYYRLSCLLDALASQVSHEEFHEFLKVL